MAILLPLSFFISLLLFPVFSFIGKRINLVSAQPLHIGGRKNVPLTGGWLIFLFFFLFGYLNKLPPGILWGATIIFFTGVWDDFHELKPLSKLLLQSISTVVVILSGVHTTIARIPFSLNYAITFLWILGITNSINLLDIMDGLASGISLFSLAGMAVVAHFNHNLLVYQSSIFLLSLLLSFLVFNFPPAKIFLGNSGSSLLGFLLSVLVLPLSFAPSGHEVALLTPLLLLGLPLYDTFFLVLERGKRGKPFHRKSEDHFALLLLKKGWGKKKILLFMYSLSALLSTCGIWLTRLSNFYAFLVILALIIILSFTGKIVSRY